MVNFSEETQTIPAPDLNSKRTGLPKIMAGAKSQADQLHNFLQKSIHAGQLYTLAEGLKLSEADIDAWFPTFLAQYKEDEQIIIEKCRILWTDDAYDERKVKCGFPKTAADIKELFDTGRLDESLFEPKLSVADMAIINAAEEPVFAEGQRVKDNKPEKCPTCKVMGSCPGTCKNVLAVYDRVIEYIGRGLHSSTKVAFEDAEEVRKALQKYRTMMAQHMHPHLRDYFLSGRYRTWEDLQNAVRRAFGVKEEKVTIPDLFKKIEEVVSAKRPVEQKMGKLSKIVKQIAIKDKNDFFVTADFEGDRIPMRHPEAYSPLVNTLLTYIMWAGIPKSKWEEIQTEFERRTDAGWSYKTWHTHRPTLYEIMDKHRGVGEVNAIENEVVEPVEDEVCAVDRGYPKMNNRRQFTPANRRRGNTQPREARGPSQARGPPLSMAERHKQNAEAPQNTRNLCNHCTHHDPFKRAVYHPTGAGFGGLGKCCLFDKSGAERKDGHGRGVDNIVYNPIEVEGFVRAVIADVPLYDDDNGADDIESAAWNNINAGNSF